MPALHTSWPALDPEKTKIVKAAFSNLSPIGQFGYIASILLSVLGLTAGLAVLGFFIAGMPLALGLGALGLAAGIPLGYLSANNPGGFHEGLGAALLTPFALPWGMLSGIISWLSAGFLQLPSFGPEGNKTLKTYFDAIHLTGHIAATAASAAAAGTLIAASAGVAIPIASAVAGAMTPPLALATGIGFLGSGVAQGVKFIIDYYTDKKKQESKEALEKQKNQKTLKKPNEPQGPPKSREPIKQDLLRLQTQEWLRTLYPAGTDRITSGTGQTQYDLPSLIALERRLPQDPKTAGLFSYGSYWIQSRTASGEPRDSRQFFSIWGPPAGGVTPTGDYGKKRGYGTHRGVDFAAPQGSAVVINQPATALYARYSGKEGKGNWGNMIILSYGEYTEDYGEFGFYGHLGRKINGQDVRGVGLLVQEGENLSPGRIIGVVGNTGQIIPHKGGDGTHLHYQHTVVTREKREWLQSKEFSDQLQNQIDNTKGEGKKRLEEIKKAALEVNYLYKKLREASPKERALATYNFLANKAVQAYLTINPLAGGANEP